MVASDQAERLVVQHAVHPLAAIVKAGLGRCAGEFNANTVFIPPANHRLVGDALESNIKQELIGDRCAEMHFQFCAFRDLIPERTINFPTCSNWSR